MLRIYFGYGRRSQKCGQKNPLTSQQRLCYRIIFILSGRYHRMILIIRARVSRFKVLFTRSLRGKRSFSVDVSASRRKHRESNVWQRRFWEHTIRNDHDLHRHIDYIHYNPVKHGLVSCPHLWEYSSFHKWVERGKYRPDWGCCCGRNLPQIQAFSDLEDFAGE
ncbi:hypothetical protein [Moorena sp. SIO3I6]|uniref:REP-associated tyrosine transposase n=1 Tax=Moorena sp. SIO3I6 TaxID=2607831 RepID=UPI0025F0505D|nr:hypothetical protein [Moorena sp. SIO3I6]